MKQIKGLAAHTIHTVFQTLLVTYLLLLVIEQVYKGAVATYLNLTYFLIVVILLGILDVFSEKPLVKQRPPTKKEYVFITVLGILGAAIIKYKTASLHWLSWVIALTAGALIILLSLIILNEEQTHS